MAATIVSSEVVSDVAQADGRRSLHERHVDSTGQEYVFHMLVSGDFDAVAALAARAAGLIPDRALVEIAQNMAEIATLGYLATVSLVYSTAAQNRAAGRAVYRTATYTQAIMIGDFLSSLSGGQLQTIFSMTSGEVATLRTNKLTSAAALAADIRAAAGQ